MHKPRQAIPKCIAKLHCIKEAAEAQNFGQVELQSGRLDDKLTLQSERPEHLRRLGKRHKAKGTPQSQRPGDNKGIQLQPAPLL